MIEMKIKQTNLNNGAVEKGKFYPELEVFYGIRAYTGHNTKAVIRKLLQGETDFIECTEFGAEIRYEVI